MLQSPQKPAQKEAFGAEIRLIDSGPKLAPDVVIRSSESKSIGGRALFVGLETYAATAGDVWLRDEASGVLIIGDLITLPAPFLDTACPARWNAALDRLSALKFDLVIPGHGAPLTKHQFETYRSNDHEHRPFRM
jgi:glyoxylase-like metal-dependent hydrolase (beta-lactamase superfamily II)